MNHRLTQPPEGFDTLFHSFEERTTSPLIIEIGDTACILRPLLDTYSSARTSAESSRHPRTIFLAYRQRISLQHEIHYPIYPITRRSPRLPRSAFGPRTSAPIFERRAHRKHPRPKTSAYHGSAGRCCRHAHPLALSARKFRFGLH